MNVELSDIIRTTDRCTLEAIAQYSVNMADDFGKEMIMNFAYSVYCPSKRTLSSLFFDWGVRLEKRLWKKSG